MAENSTEINQVKDILTALVTSHDTETIRQAETLLTKHLPVGEEDLMSRLPEHLQGKIKNDVRVLCCTDAVSDIHS
jgi:hypothetical protein